MTNTVWSFNDLSDRELLVLEFHHVTPHAAGGETSVENLQVRCRVHNAYEAEKYSGARRATVAARAV